MSLTVRFIKLICREFFCNYSALRKPRYVNIEKHGENYFKLTCLTKDEKGKVYKIVNRFQKERVKLSSYYLQIDEICGTMFREYQCSSTITWKVFIKALYFGVKFNTEKSYYSARNDENIVEANKGITI